MAAAVISPIASSNTSNITASSTGTPSQQRSAARPSTAQQPTTQSLPSGTTQPLRPTSGSSTPGSAPFATPQGSQSNASWLHCIYDRVRSASVRKIIVVTVAVIGTILTIRYGEAALIGLKWTMKNDFRASCDSDRAADRPLSARCEEELAGPPQPPPVKKREAREGTHEGLLKAFGALVAIIGAFSATDMAVTAIVQMKHKEGLSWKSLAPAVMYCLMCILGFIMVYSIISLTVPNS